MRLNPYANVQKKTAQEMEKRAKQNRQALLDKKRGVSVFGIFCLFPHDTSLLILLILEFSLLTFSSPFLKISSAKGPQGKRGKVVL